MSYRPKPELSNVPAIPDHIYYDVLVTNFNSVSGAPIPIYFNENRTNPIVPITGEYEMSIIRFSVDTPDLPVLIPIIQQNAVKDDLTNYSITLTLKPEFLPYTSPAIPVANTITYISQANIIWVTQDTSAPIPPTPFTNGGFQSTVGTYYYCYSYQHFQSLVDATLARAWVFLKDALVTAGYIIGITNPEIDGVNAPVFSWDAGLKTAVLSTPQFKADGVSPCFENLTLVAGVPTINEFPVKIFFNAPLYQLFNSFNSTFRGTTNSLTTTALGQGYYQNPNYTSPANLSIVIPSGFTISGLNYQLNIINQGGTTQILIPNIYPITPPVSAATVENLYIQTFQEYTTIINWTPVASIVFVSNTLPIVSNQLASPLIYNENVIVPSNGNNANFAQIITDIETNEQSYKPNLLYNPLAEYRMISMTGNRPLTNVDISVFWKTKLGTFVPLNLLSGGSCSVKFLFRKRIV